MYGGAVISVTQRTAIKKTLEGYDRASERVHFNKIYTKNEGVTELP